MNMELIFRSKLIFKGQSTILTPFSHNGEQKKKKTNNNNNNNDNKKTFLKTHLDGLVIIFSFRKLNILEEHVFQNL